MEGVLFVIPIHSQAKVYHNTEHLIQPSDQVIVWAWMGRTMDVRLRMEKTSDVSLLFRYSHEILLLSGLAHSVLIAKGQTKKATHSSDRYDG